MTDKFLFTIVMAVFNVELFLREAIESVITQSIGLEKIQLILVDDGSTDNSGKICNEYAESYPNNIICLHQKNAGVSSARNAAKPYIQGRYVNYLDSDDKLSEGTLLAVSEFYSLHEHETDVVAIPIFYFEGRTGAHRLNDKFEHGARIINLQEEWDSVQLSMSSSFVRADALKERVFISDLHYGEDTQVLLDILLEKPMLGVVPEAKYMYRLRTRGESSALQRSMNDPRHFLPKMKYLIEKTIETSISKNGEIPKFIQYALVYDLQWIIRKNKFPQGVLSEKDEKEYLCRLFKVLPYFSNEIILAQKYLTPEQKYYLIRKKEGREPEIRRTCDDLQLCYDSCCVGSLTDAEIHIDFVRIHSDSCIIEGYIPFFPLNNTNINVVMECNGKQILCERVPEWREQSIFGEPLMLLQGFRVKVPLDRHSAYTIRCGVKSGVTRKNLSLKYGWYAPVNDTFQNGYYYHDGHCMTGTTTGMTIQPAGACERVKKEINLLLELFFSSKNHRRKAALIRVLYWMVKPFFTKPVWLVSDRPTRAGDNGEAFFRYLKKNHPEIDTRFVLQKKSTAYSDLSKIGKIIENDTIQEKLIALLSDCIISSQAEVPYLNPLYRHRDVFRDIMADRRFVFLQHGIIKDDLSGWLMRPNKNFYGFVTSTEPEYRSIIEGHYGYTEKEIWLTGLPRYDFLEKKESPKLITVMPTWRRFLMLEQDLHTMAYPLVSDFTESLFYRFYNDLLNDTRLLEAAHKNGYQLAFLPHPTLQPHLDVFKKHDDVYFFGLETDYKDVYRDSAMVVTDYSSAVFDAAYLYRPVVYAHFDQDVFFSGEHIYQKGYFDYEKDGFGEVEYTYDETVNRMISYIETGCRMKQTYKERVDRFFAYHDRNNCQRVYDKIMEGRE